MTKPRITPAAERETIEEHARTWVVRQDRGLSSEESRQLADWLQADPSHSAALARSQAAWRKFRELGQAVKRMPLGPVEQVPQWNWLPLAGMAAAAAIVLGVGFWQRTLHPLQSVPAAASMAPVAQTQKFPDGSVATLKAGAQIVQDFTPTARRIRLIKGEVFFSVAKDPARPFLVETGNVTVRAVGTAFSVMGEGQAVNVLVTEGVVQVSAPSAAVASQPVANPTEEPTLVGAGQRAIVTRHAESSVASVVVSQVTEAEISRSLAWHYTMLDLTSAPLGELIALYTARSGQKVELGDPRLATLQIGGRLPTHDVDGFIRALELVADIKAEKRADGVLILTKRK